MKKSLILIALAFVLTACQFSPFAQPTATPTVTPEPTATQTPVPTATATATATPEPVCSADELIEKLKPLVPYEYFTLSYHKISDYSILFFWIMDPNLNPQATEAELTENTTLAVSDAIELAHLLNQADPCVAKLFNSINPVVVDNNHNGWFSAIIDITLLPEGPNLTESDKITITNNVMLTTTGLFLRTTVPDIQEIPSDSCTWPEVLEKVSWHFFDDPQNAYMLVADPSGVSFTVQFQSTESANMMIVFLNTAREAACLQPPVNNIIVLLVDEEGNVAYVDSYPIELYDEYMGN